MLNNASAKSNLLEALDDKQSTLFNKNIAKNKRKSEESLNKKILIRHIN